MKRVLKVVMYFVLALVVFFALFFATEAVLSRIPASVNIKQLPQKYEVYVLSNDVHTDIVMPVVSDIIDWRTIFPTQNTKSQDSTYKYIAIGWGDKGFYLNTPEWKDLKASTALVAALGIGETALHVTYYHHMTEDNLCYKVAVDEIQLKKLKEYVFRAYDTDAQGQPILIHTNAQYGNSDAFYEAKGSYSMFYSCNTWANEGLKSANLPSGVWTIFDKGILRHYGYKK